MSEPATINRDEIMTRFTYMSEENIPMTVSPASFVHMFYEIYQHYKSDSDSGTGPSGFYNSDLRQPVCSLPIENLLGEYLQYLLHP